MDNDTLRKSLRFLVQRAAEIDDMECPYMIDPVTLEKLKWQVGEYGLNINEVYFVTNEINKNV